MAGRVVLDVPKPAVRHAAQARRDRPGAVTLCQSEPGIRVMSQGDRPIRQEKVATRAGTSIDRGKPPQRRFPPCCPLSPGRAGSASPRSSFRPASRAAIVPDTRGERVALYRGWIGIRARLGGHAGRARRGLGAGGPGRGGGDVRPVRRRLVGGAIAGAALASPRRAVNSSHDRPCARLIDRSVALRAMALREDT